MAQIYGSESKYLITQQKTNTWFSKGHYFIALIIGGVIVALILTVIKSVPIQELSILRLAIILFLIFIACAAFLYFYSQRERRSKNYESGRAGELLVFNTLKQLPDDNHVLQDINLGSVGNIDFVLTRPNEVFSLEVKNHAGRVSFDGRKLLWNGRPFPKNILSQVRLQERILKDFLFHKMGHEFPIIPVLVFANPKCYVDINGPVLGIPVIHQRVLFNFLQNYAHSQKPLNVIAVVEFLKPYIGK